MTRLTPEQWAAMSEDVRARNADLAPDAPETAAKGSRAAPAGSDAPAHRLAQASAEPLGYRCMVPLRVGRGLNEREHHMARHKRCKAERAAVLEVLGGLRVPPGPWRVLLTRVAPAAESRPLDSDNLTAGMKSVRDAVAKWLDTDDRDLRSGGQVQWDYDQRAGLPRTYGVEVCVWGVWQP